MHPSKVDRTRLRKLTDLPNVGRETARDLVLLGITSPSQLEGRDPVVLYDALCDKTRTRQDPCVLDVLISLTRFMDGDAPQVWWAYTAERKRMMAALAR
ncbi:MAG: helix-hairpin-helix domain-containing protein [Gemmatimonadetes bacterium]|nr:helix-hairpin-helix domain-containing protein [Gemmatimonadota bacterium]